MLRRAACVLTGLFCAAAAGCGSRPTPTLDDYSWGTAAFVRTLEPLFTEGRPLATGNLSDPAAAAALNALAERWVTTTAAGRQAFLRIVEFKHFKHSGVKRAELMVEVRLQGVAKSDPRERVAGLSHFRLALERTSDEGKQGAWRLASARDSSPDRAFLRARPHLAEEARAAGLDLRHESGDPADETNISIPATHHHAGILLVDVDADGALDVIVPNRRPHFFRNDGSGRFVDRTAGSGLDLLPEGDAAGGAAADLDGDGLPDLFLTYTNTTCRLLRNEGGGRFRDVTEAWGLAGIAGPYTSVVLFDADRDGRVDLYVICYGDARKTGPAYNGFN
ncbi:MAG: VCBS repeat-containing protein, partial [Thermoanaerobaculia bacterium]